jgi:hypothetical protein
MAALDAHTAAAHILSEVLERMFETDESGIGIDTDLDLFGRIQIRIWILVPTTYSTK